MVEPTLLHVALLGSIVLGVAGALLAWRQRPEPGSVPLVALLVGQCWWSATLIFKVQATTVPAKTFWLNISWIGVGIIPVAWLLFSLEYTGYDQYVRPLYVVPLSVIPAVSVFLALTNQYHEFIFFGTGLVERNGLTVLEWEYGIWYYVMAGYTYLLGLAGLVPLLQLVTSELDVFQGQSIAILVGLVVPWISNILFNLGLQPVPGVDLTPVAFTISGIAYLAALTRFRLFATNPSPLRQANRLVFDHMQAGALVLDNHEHVVEMNENAGRAIGTPRPAALGSPVHSLVDDPTALSVDASRSGFDILESAGGDRSYEVSATEITNVRDQEIGRVVTLHDVTEHLKQQQRLEVLNRVFRHNIRTNTQVIVGHVEHLATEGHERYAERVVDKAMEIQAISDKVRNSIELFEQRRTATGTVALRVVLDSIVSEIRSAHPDVSVDCGPVPAGVRVASPMKVVVENVLENAVVHNTSAEPEVRMTVERDGDVVRIVTADNGPGIDDNERLVLDGDGETKLDHGSGLGLALIAWGTDVVGGETTYAENDPTGTVVTVEAPVVEPAGEN